MMSHGVGVATSDQLAVRPQARTFLHVGHDPRDLAHHLHVHSLKRPVEQVVVSLLRIAVQYSKTLSRLSVARAWCLKCSDGGPEMGNCKKSMTRSS